MAQEVVGWIKKRAGSPVIVKQRADGQVAVGAIGDPSDENNEWMSLNEWEALPPWDGQMSSRTDAQRPSRRMPSH